MAFFRVFLSFCSELIFLRRTLPFSGVIVSTLLFKTVNTDNGFVVSGSYTVALATEPVKTGTFVFSTFQEDKQSYTIVLLHTYWKGIDLHFVLESKRNSKRNR